MMLVAENIPTKRTGKMVLCAPLVETNYLKSTENPGTLFS